MKYKPKGRTVPPPTTPPPAAPSGPTVAQLLDTDDASLQTARVGELLRMAQPTWTLVIQDGPSGFALQPVGPNMPVDVIYSMLERALQATRQEERRQRDAQLAALQAAAAPPQAESVPA